MPGLIAFVFGFFAFRSRIKGVYFSIITQAMTFAAMLLFFRNETGFGGNNGFTDFKRILGIPIATQEMRMTLFVLTGLTLLGFFLFARWLIGSKFGRVLQAIRDAESRVMFSGYNPLRYKLTIWIISAMMCGVAGALYVPQVGIINPGEMSAGQLDRDRDLGRGRRPRHADRPDRRRLHRQRRQELAHGGRAGVLALLPGRAVHRRHAVPAQRRGRLVKQWASREGGAGEGRREAQRAVAAEQGVEPAALAPLAAEAKGAAHDARPDGSRRRARRRATASARSRCSTESGGRAAGFGRVVRRPARWTSRTAASCTWKT